MNIVPVRVKANMYIVVAIDGLKYTVSAENDIPLRYNSYNAVMEEIAGYRRMLAVRPSDAGLAGITLGSDEFYARMEAYRAKLR